MYGAHPYGRPVDGRRETVRRFTREDLQRWHRTYIQPDRAVLSMITPLPVSVIRRQIERRFKGWKTRAPRRRPRLGLRIAARFRPSACA